MFIAAEVLRLEKLFKLQWFYCPIPAKHSPEMNCSILRWEDNCSPLDTERFNKPWGFRLRFPRMVGGFAPNRSLFDPTVPPFLLPPMEQTTSSPFALLKMPIISSEKLNLLPCQLLNPQYAFSFHNLLFGDLFFLFLVFNFSSVINSVGTVQYWCLSLDNKNNFIGSSLFWQWKLLVSSVSLSWKF